MLKSHILRFNHKQNASVRPCLQGGRVTLLARVTLARGLQDSPHLYAKFTGRVTLLTETTWLVALR